MIKRFARLDADVVAAMNEAYAAVSVGILGAVIAVASALMLRTLV